MLTISLAWNVEEISDRIAGCDNCKRTAKHSNKNIRSYIEFHLNLRSGAEYESTLSDHSLIHREVTDTL